MLSKYKKLVSFGTFSKKRNWLYILILCVAVFASFYPSPINDFQQEWDDQWMLLENPILFYPSEDAIVHLYYMTAQKMEVDGE